MRKSLQKIERTDLVEREEIQRHVFKHAFMHAFNFNVKKMKFLSLSHFLFFL